MEKRLGMNIIWIQVIVSIVDKMRENRLRLVGQVLNCKKLVWCEGVGNC